MAASVSAVGSTSAASHQSKGSIVSRPPSTLLSTRATVHHNTGRRPRLISKKDPPTHPPHPPTPLIRFQAGAGDWRINVVSFLFLAETQRDLRLHRNVFLLPVIKHLILRVADHSLYADVCADANLSTHTHKKTLPIFTLSFIFYAVLFYFSPTQKNEK